MSTLKVNTIQDASGNNGTTPALLYNGTAKAWCSFDGTGVVAIRASYNVTSITDNGTGDYTVNFTNALADAKYSIVGSSSASGTTGGSRAIVVSEAVPPTASAVRIYNVYTTAAYDNPYINVSIFR